MKVKWLTHLSVAIFALSAFELAASSGESTYSTLGERPCVVTISSTGISAVPSKAEVDRTPDGRIAPHETSRITGIRGWSEVDDFDRVIHVEVNRGDVTARQLQNLPRLRHLRSFKMHGQGDLDNSWLQHLAACTSLRRLELWQQKLVNADLNQIAEIPRLTELAISANNITDRGLRHLSRLQSLEVLDISSNAVTDDGLIHLKDLPNLKVLTLYGTKATPAGLQKLQGSDLEEVRTSFGRSMLPYLHLLPRIRRISFSGQLIADEDLVHVARLPNLEELDLSHNQATAEFPPITDKGIAHIAALSKLRVLNLRHSDVTDAAMSHIAKLRDLRHLDISGTRVTNDGLTPLAELKHLQTLNISDLEFGRAVDLSHIPSLGTVEAYNLRVDVLVDRPDLRVVMFD